jgi:hypothetical protein
LEGFQALEIAGGGLLDLGEEVDSFLGEGEAAVTVVGDKVP